MLVYSKSKKQNRQALGLLGDLCWAQGYLMYAAALNGFSRSEKAVLEVIRARGQVTRRDVATAVGLGRP